MAKQRRLEDVLIIKFSLTSKAGRFAKLEECFRICAGDILFGKNKSHFGRCLRDVFDDVSQANKIST